MPVICLLNYSPPQSRSFVHLLPLLPESRTSERLCQIRDVSEDILCISKYIVSLHAKFTTGLHKIFTDISNHQVIILVHSKLKNVQGEW